MTKKNNLISFFKRRKRCQIQLFLQIQTSIQNIPVNLFGSVMAFAGLSMGWDMVKSLFGFDYGISHFFYIITISIFIILSIFYILKIIMVPKKVREEFTNPISSNFFATIAISLLLISALFIAKNILLAKICWISGTIFIALLCYLSVYKWINNSQSLHTLSPPWIIPVVGSLDVAIAGVKLHYYYISLFFTSIGLIFGLVLFTLIFYRIIFYRIIFHEQLPYKLQPSFLILSAPFSVGVSAYLEFSKNFDFFAFSLFNFSLFLILVIVSKIVLLKDCCTFTFNWWAIGFPLAAFNIASLKANEAQPNYFFATLAVGALTITSIVIALLFLQTIYKIYKKELMNLK